MPWLLVLVVAGVVLVAALLLLYARLGGECRSSGSIAAGIPHRTPVPRLGAAPHVGVGHLRLRTEVVVEHGVLCGLGGTRWSSVLA